MRRRGASLHLVLVLVMLLSMLALSMTALYVSNLNFAHAGLNRGLAQQEAETALNELVARLTQNPAYGLNGEILSGTASPGLHPGQAYHVISFQRGGSWPYSTNNLSGGARGYPDQALPAGSVHVMAVGFCKGQTCTLEVLLQHPPFPYGLAVDGPVRSNSSLVVRGTTGVGPNGELEYDRPGHVASNRAGNDTVDIPGEQTYITGFIQTPGTIRLHPRAVVRGGLKPLSQEVELPRIDFSQFQALESEGVRVQDREFFERQNLNTLYYSPNDLTFQSGIQFQKGLVRCLGNVTVRGGLSGEGALIVDGDVTIVEGATLSGSNRVAVVSRGKITIQGGGSYFQGLVYSEKELEADKVTIVGNTVVNLAPGSTASGSASLKENVVIVGDESVARMKLRVARPGTVQYQNEPGRFPLKPQTGAARDGVFYFPETPEGLGVAYYPPDDDTDYLSNWLNASRDALWNTAKDPGGSPLRVHTGVVVTEALESKVLYEQLGWVAVEARDIAEELEQAQRAGDDIAVARLQGDLDSKHDEFMEVEAQARAAFMRFYDQHTRLDGSVVHTDNPGQPPREFDFELNTFMPPSESFRITYWQLHPGKR